MAKSSTDKDVEINIASLKAKYKISDNPLLVRIQDRLQQYVFGEGKPYEYKEIENDQEQIDLKELRNKYLHWSSTRKGFGLDPTDDRIRVIY